MAHHHLSNMRIHWYIAFPKNYSKAFEFYTKAAKQDNAQYYLGLMYAKGTPQSFSKAIELQKLPIKVMHSLTLG